MLCCPLLIKAPPKFRQRDIADDGVTALPVVIDLDIVKNGGLRLCSGRVMLVINHFQLDGDEKGLGTSVVIAQELTETLEAAHTAQC